MARPPAAKRRSRQRSAPRRIARRVRHMEMGRRMRTRADPPNLSLQPWWSVCLVLTDNFDSTHKMTDITPSDIAKSLISQCFPSIALTDIPKFASTMVFRLKSIRTWGVGSQPISLTVYDEIGSDSSLRTVADYGGKISFSHVGWSYGLTAVAVSHPMASTSPNPGLLSTPKFCTIESGPGKTLTYVTIDYRAGTSYSLPSVVTLMSTELPSKALPTVPVDLDSMAF